MKDKDAGLVTQEFGRRRKRQVTAIAVAVFLVVALAAKTRLPGLLIGTVSPPTVSALMIAVIAVFILFSALNWRCPACGAYLGSGLEVERCRSCGARLQRQ